MWWGCSSKKTVSLCYQDMASHRKAYMVDSDKGAVRPADFAACVLEAFKGLLFNLLAAKQKLPDARRIAQTYWRGHFVDQMSV
jgi:hypothetical protein